MSQNTADTINDILRGVMKPGGFGQNLVLDKPSAGKTGTISDNKAVWFDGYTPAIATVSMIAGANQVGQPITLNGQTIGGQYVASAHGSTTAGPMWADAMRAIQDLLPNLDFTPPTQIAAIQVPVPVPDVVGLPVNDAISQLTSQGFSVALFGSRNGLVVSMSPGGGTTANSGSTVTLTSSTLQGGAQPPGNTGTGNGNGKGKGKGH
jgi:membrane carboxypeptidase/penicillin-binding protein